MPRVPTAANGVTLFRVGLSVAGGALLVSGGPCRVVVWLLAVSMLLDALDGWMARRLRQETVFGALLDPIADKVTILIAFGAIALRSNSPAVWTLFVLGAVRDAGVTFQRCARVGWGRHGIQSDSAGKFKTALQYAVALAVLFHDTYAAPGGEFSPAVVTWLTGSCVAASYLSWGRYALSFRRLATTGGNGGNVAEKPGE